MGFDAIVFHYRRTMAAEDHLTGTFYGADLDFLEGPTGFNISLPIHGNRKEETGARIYSELKDLTTTIQYTKQLVAGLHREGYELETGYKVPFAFGPTVHGDRLFQYVQPTVRFSGLVNRFKGPKTFVAPSVWWNWTKLDYGFRVGLAKNVDITAERAKHHIEAPIKLQPNETLVTLRVRI